MGDDESGMSVVSGEFLLVSMVVVREVSFDSDEGLVSLFDVEFDEKRLVLIHFQLLKLVTKPENRTRNIDAFEALHELEERHREYSIVLANCWPHLLLDVLGHTLPELVVSFTCEPCILCLSPGVSEFHQSTLFAVAEDILAVEHCVGVRGLESFESDAGLGSGYNRHHLVSCVEQLLPNHVQVLRTMVFFNLIVVARSNRKGL